MRLKLDKADIAFSEFVRTRDGRCVRCKRPGDGPKGIFGLQCSHFFGRRRESTRFDPENCDALCFGCHQIWGSENHEAYRDFKVRQLGEEGFQKLRLRAEIMFTKKNKENRKAQQVFWKLELKKLKGSK